LSAWVIERLNAIPRGSEVVRQGNIRILVRKVRRQRVLEASLMREEPEATR
jgi:CBS domain containing-hemolysin-like protein